jgi:predicted phosphoadenosine phosphosulfate sulfurtransferase
MSSNFWQMKKQSQQYDIGRSVTERVKIYETIWEKRCYQGGIPQEVPPNIAKTHRAPSYKALALAILKNDFNFYSIGFPQRESEIVNLLTKQNKTKQSKK